MHLRLAVSYGAHAGTRPGSACEVGKFLGCVKFTALWCAHTPAISTRNMLSNMRGRPVGAHVHTFSRTELHRLSGGNLLRRHGRVIHFPSKHTFARTRALHSQALASSFYFWSTCWHAPGVSMRSGKFLCCDYFTALWCAHTHAQQHGRSSCWYKRLHAHSCTDCRKESPGTPRQGHPFSFGAHVCTHAGSPLTSARFCRFLLEHTLARARGQYAKWVISVV